MWTVVRRSALILSFALTAVAACSLDAATDATPVAHLDEIPSLAYEEVARIGSFDDPDHGFSRIGPVHVDSDGSVYVVEAQDVEIRVYSAAGELLRRIGRRGDGPGEFRGPLHSFGVRGDTVWVFDSGLRRVSVFNRTGALLSSASVENVQAQLHIRGQMVMIWPSFMDDHGLLVGDVGMAMAVSGPPERDTALVPLVRFGTDGRVIDTVGHQLRTRPGDGTAISVGRSRHLLPLPPSAGPRRILTAREQVTIEHDVVDGSGQIRLTRVTHAGDTVRARQFAFRPRPFPDSVLDSIAAARAHATGPLLWFSTADGLQTLERHAADSAAARVAIRRQMPFPEVQPPVQGHRVTAGDALWLQRENLGGGTRRWTVLDGDDEPIGELELPAGLRVVWAGADSFWAVEPDEFDVPWLVRYRILPAA